MIIRNGPTHNKRELSYIDSRGLSDVEEERSYIGRINQSEHDNERLNTRHENHNEDVSEGVTQRWDRFVFLRNRTEPNRTEKSLNRSEPN